MASYKSGLGDKMKKITIQDEMGNDYLPLKMTIDRKTEMYVKFAKVMVILQGPYTPQRESVSKDVETNFKYAARVISDDTYKREENTICKVEETEEFHSYFQKESKRALEEGHNLLVIDSTLSNIRQNSYYAALAHQMQYVILLAPPIVTGLVKDQWPSKSQAASFRSTGTFIQSATQFQHLFCAWYLHDVDSYELRHEAALYFRDCVEEIPEFKEMFSKVKEAEVHLDMDAETFANKVTNGYFKLDDKWQDLAYCCTKIFNNQMFSMNEYFKNEKVASNYGKMSKLMIAGFVVSPHMIAARVKITFHQKDLWDMPDEIDENSRVPLVCPSELLGMLKSELPDVKAKQICSKSNRTLINSSRTTHDPTENIPKFAKGRGCHFVLARAAGASARDVDYGVQIALRRISRADGDCEKFDLMSSVVRRVGKYWVIDLKEMNTVDGFFASCVKPFPYENSISSISSPKDL